MNLPQWNFVNKNTVVVDELDIGFAVVTPNMPAEYWPHSWNTFEMAVDKVVVVDSAPSLPD